MRGVRDFLVDRDTVQLIVAVAIGFLVAEFFEQVAETILRAAWAGNEFTALPYMIHVGDHTIELLGPLFQGLSLLFALGLVWLLVRRGPSSAGRRECPHCLAEVPAAAHVCRFCTRELQPAA